MAISDLLTNVMKDVGTILTNPHLEGKPSALATYLRITAKEIAVRRGLMKSPSVERIGRQQLTFPTYGMIWSLWREIYAKTPYFFVSTSAHPTILDVGSNIGMAVLYMKHIYPGSRITAFEPDPKAYKVLQENVELNRLNDVNLVNKAVFDHTGFLEWHFDNTRPDSLSMSAVARASLPDTMRIPCVRLSEFIGGPVDFVKLDVEGVEGEVLQELCESRKIEQIRQMAIEYHPWSKQTIAAILERLEAEKFIVRVESEGPSTVAMIFARKPAINQ
jgi:FkbM family methyltransferase